MLLFTYHYSARCFWHEYAKIPRHTSKIPLPQAIWNNFGYVTENGVNSNYFAPDLVSINKDGLQKWIEKY
mgnify:CR=1 FL=1